MGGIVYSPHPAFQKGSVVVEDRSHPATRNLPDSFEISDEWYEFDRSPRPNVRVLARADESTYKPNKPMGDHPMIWTNERYDRVLYIGIGHAAALCDDANFAVLIRDAILWAASPAKP
jgi:type 1 glutamine amidotransferase